jgi:hypothetical protein
MKTKPIFANFDDNKLEQDGYPSKLDLFIKNNKINNMERQVYD